jgi:hypothetical protein
MCILLETHAGQKLNFFNREFSTEFSTATVEVFAKPFFRRFSEAEKKRNALLFGTLVPLRHHLISAAENRART